MRNILRIGIIGIAFSLMSMSCSENYSNGERIGTVTQFSSSGQLYKSHEGHLNTTQTGMNSSVPFDFSIDNDKEDPALIKTIDSAAQNGWKVKLIYHEVKGYNWFHNRGNTDHFVTKCEVLDRNFSNTSNPFHQGNTSGGKVIDTIYVVVDKRELIKSLKKKPETPKPDYVIEVGETEQVDLK